MQGIMGFCVLLVWLWLGIWLVVQKTEPEEEEPNFFDSIRVEQEVDLLHKKMQKLREYDEMIIDLRLCRPSAVQRAFRMEWMSAAGINHAIDVMADGENPSTKYMLELAIDERAALNEEIQQRIFDLYTRCCVEDFYSEISEGKSYTV